MTRRKRESDTFEGLIGDAVLGLADHEVTLRRAAVKYAVCTKIFCSCDCGNILDQATSALITVEGENGKRGAIAVCKHCKPHVIAGVCAAIPADHYRIETWDDCVGSLPEGGASCK